MSTVAVEANAEVDNIKESWEELQNLDINDAANVEKTTDISSTNGDEGHHTNKKNDSPSSAQSPAAPETSAIPSAGNGYNTSSDAISNVEIDQALLDALALNKHRSFILQIELEVEEFINSADQTEHIFQRDISSFDRLLTHRAAQYWGLETSTITTPGPHHGRIVAYKKPASTPSDHVCRPPMKLADIPIEIEGNTESSTTLQPGAAPKVLIRAGHPQPRRHHHHHHHHNYNSHNSNQYYNNRNSAYHLYNQQQQPRRQRSQYSGHDGYNEHSEGPRRAGDADGVEDKELHYERARARIFGGDEDNDNTDSGGAGQDYEGGQHAQHDAPKSAGNNRVLVVPNPHAQHNKNLYNNNNNNKQQYNVKAQFRNRNEDLFDPDFRRHQPHLPQFDPGYDDMMMPMMHPYPVNGPVQYLHPTYASEFPALNASVGSHLPKGGQHQHPHPPHHQPMMHYPYAPHMPPPPPLHPYGYPPMHHHVPHPAAPPAPLPMNSPHGGTNTTSPGGAHGGTSTESPMHYPQPPQAAAGAWNAPGAVPSPQPLSPAQEHPPMMYHQQLPPPHTMVTMAYPPHPHAGTGPSHVMPSGYGVPMTQNQKGGEALSGGAMQSHETQGRNDDDHRVTE